MQKKAGFGVGAFLLVGGFCWLVFDNLALGLIFGFFAGCVAATRAREKDAQS